MLSCFEIDEAARGVRRARRSARLEGSYGERGRAENSVASRSALQRVVGSRRPIRGTRGTRMSVN